MKSSRVMCPLIVAIKPILRKLLTIAVLLFVSNQALASTIVFEQSPDELNAPSAVSDVIRGRQAFDDFVPDRDITLHDIHWFGRIWDSSFDPINDMLTFDIEIYDADGSSPSLAPFFEVTVNPKVMATSESFLFEFWVDPIEPVNLSADTIYWVSIFESAGEFEHSWLFADYRFDEPFLTGLHFSRLIGGGGDLFSIGDLAFSLTIPEPTTLALITIGMVGIGFSRRRNLVK